MLWFHGLTPALGAWIDRREAGILSMWRPGIGARPPLDFKRASSVPTFGPWHWGWKKFELSRHSKNQSGTTRLAVSQGLLSEQGWLLYEDWRVSQRSALGMNLHRRTAAIKHEQCEIIRVFLWKDQEKATANCSSQSYCRSFHRFPGECWWWHGLVHKQSKVMLCAELHERTPLLLKKHSMLPLQNIYKPANDLALATPEKLWTRLSISLCFCKPPDCNTTCMCTYARTCVTWSKVHAHSCWFQTYCCLASFA